MNSILKRALLSISIAILLASLAGCSGTTTAGNGTNSTPSANGANVAAANSQTDEDKKKNPNYRPIEKAIDEGELKNLDGSMMRVADKRGKVVILNMWATWCGPCRAEMPTLVKMQEAHRDRGLEIIGLNTDEETVDQINDFVTDMKLNYTIAWADTKYQLELLKISKFQGIPQSFIIDRDGNLRGVFRGAAPADVKKMEELVDLIVNE